jgi:hypothetical protein
VADFEKLKSTSFTAFRSAAEEDEGKREINALKADEQSFGDEGGHMSSTAGRVMRVSGADLPYIVILAHHESETTEHQFATMREAEAYIRRNTPVPGAILSTKFDRPAPRIDASLSEVESNTISEHILLRLKIIDLRLRQLSTEDGAFVLARGMANAGLNEHQSVRLVAETERILDELDRKNEE